MTRTILSRSSALLVIFTLAACGHGGPTSVLPATPAANARTKATIAIKIPNRDSAVAARYYGKGQRKRDYVSPATRSIAIAATDSTNVTTVVDATLTLVSNGCVSTAISTLCSVQVNLTPGTYTMAFTTYDGPLDANGKPTGNELSLAGGVPFTVTAGSNNLLNVSLAGQPAGVNIAPSVNEHLVRGNEATGFALMVKYHLHEFNVYAYDADGDPIIGPGAPTFTSSLANTVQVDIDGPIATLPNTFYLDYEVFLGEGFPAKNTNLASYTPPAIVTMTAVPPAGSDVNCTPAICSRSVTVSSLDLYFAATSSGSGLYPAGDGAPLYTTSIAAQTSYADVQNGDMYFSSAGTVYKWAEPYTSVPVALFSLPIAGDTVLNLTLDGNKIVYVSDASHVYSSALPYTTVTEDSNIMFNFNGTAPGSSRLAPDGNGKLIAADSSAVVVFNSNFTGTAQLIKIGSAAITFAAVYPFDLLIADPSAHVIGDYTYDSTASDYAYVSNNDNTNGETLSPLVSDGSTLYAPWHNSGEIAEYSLPLGTGAPRLIKTNAIGTADDFVLTGDDTGYASIYGTTPNIDETFDFASSNVSEVLTSVSGTSLAALAVIH